jgi:hypothetical protein
MSADDKIKKVAEATEAAAAFNGTPIKPASTVYFQFNVPTKVVIVGLVAAATIVVIHKAEKANLAEIAQNLNNQGAS